MVLRKRRRVTTHLADTGEVWAEGVCVARVRYQLRVVQDIVMLISETGTEEQVGPQDTEGSVTILDDPHWWVLLKQYEAGQWLHLPDGRRLPFVAEGAGGTLHLRAIGPFVSVAGAEKEEMAVG